MYGDRLHVHVHPLWLRENEISGHKRHFRDLAKLNGVLLKFSGAPCIYCGKQVGNKLIHYITACSKYDGTREYFWTLIVNGFSVSISAYLHNASDEILTAIILGRSCRCAGIDTTNEEALLLDICAKVWQILPYEVNLKEEFC